jgi:hypothetical protein
MTTKAEQWAEFSGKPNTEALLSEKAKVVAALIEMALGTGIFVARSIKENQEGLDANRSDDNVETIEPIGAFIETAALLLRVVDEFAFKCLSLDNRHFFITCLETLVTEKLGERGISRDEFKLLLAARYGEYTHYKSWVPDTNESAKGTLFWEYAKKMAFETGVGKNALFNLSLSNMLLRQLRRWNIPGLLRG